MSKLSSVVKTGLVTAACGIGLCAVAKKLKLPSRFADFAHSIEGVPFPGVNLYSFLASSQLRLLYAQIAEEITSASHFDNILDLTTGVGLLPIEIAGRDSKVHVTGLDHSQQMIQLAKTNAKAAHVGSSVEFSVGEQSNLPFPGRYFDLVVSVNALHHWKDTVIVMEEVFHVLKPGGEFWIYDYRCDVDEEVWEEAEKNLPTYLGLPFLVGPKASWKAACAVDQLTSMIRKTHFENVSVEPRSYTLFGQQLPVFNRIVLKKPLQVHEE